MGRREKQTADQSDTKPVGDGELQRLPSSVCELLGFVASKQEYTTNAVTLIKVCTFALLSVLFVAGVIVGVALIATGHVSSGVTVGAGALGSPIVGFMGWKVIRALLGRRSTILDATPQLRTVGEPDTTTGIQPLL